MIAVLDYGSGNLHSVRSALNLIGVEACVTRNPEDLRAADRIILPGVGAFSECLKNLRASGMVEALEEEVLEKGKPFYGICVGLQVLAREGHEFGVHKGLGWVPGVVKRFDVEAQGLKVPHVGWNEIIARPDVSLFNGIKENAAFYFVHSYRIELSDPTWQVAECDYGKKFTAAILHHNIFATQFHPEKSQETGLRLLENFCKWNP